MSKQDYVALAGMLFVAGGLYAVYAPLAAIFVGVVCMRIARTMNAKKGA